MCKKFQVYACAGECLLKDAEQHFQEKPITTLILGAGH